MFKQTFTTTPFKTLQTKESPVTCCRVTDMCELIKMWQCIFKQTQKAKQALAEYKHSEIQESLPAFRQWIILMWCVPATGNDSDLFPQWNLHYSDTLLSLAQLGVEHEHIIPSLASHIKWWVDNDSFLYVDNTTEHCARRQHSNWQGVLVTPTSYKWVMVSLVPKGPQRVPKGSWLQSTIMEIKDILVSNMEDWLW